MREELVLAIQERVLKELDFTSCIEDQEILHIIDKCLLDRCKTSYIDVNTLSHIRRILFNRMRKLDALQELIEDEAITEIMVNGPSMVFIEKAGRILKSDVEFESREKLEDVIQRIISESNRVVNESNPIVDSHLSDGSRVNVVLYPIARNGPILTIRKFPKNPITVHRLIEMGSINEEIAGFLEKLVIAKYNIFISGGTGSGKTTFLNALSNFIPSDERIITIEDSAELQIQSVPNLVSLEVRNANVEGCNGISIRDLIKSALRMRPDRIIVGEVRDSAAIDMLTALNTGHDGSLSTGHANSPEDMLYRLETLVLMGLDIPLMAVRRQIASALDIIIHLGRLRDKTRRVLQIDEVLDCVDGQILLRPLYEFHEHGTGSDGRVTGGLEKTEFELVNKEKLERAGMII